MTRRSFRFVLRPRASLDQLLLTSAVALVLSALPVSVSPVAPTLDWHSAHARGPGGDGPGGVGGPADHGRDVAGQTLGGHGPGERGRGGGGHAYGHAKGQGGQAGGARGYHDVNEFLDHVRNGKAFGLERRDERVTAARDRYQQALDNRGKPAGHGLDPDQIGPVAHQFTPDEARALAERGWKGPAVRTDGFRNHGERVRTMVELAKHLGYGARVGALQANFGTPYENQIATLQDELAEAQAAEDQAEIERLEAELAEAIANAKPGVGPDDSWATADLDVNDDGVVDRRDLEAARQTDSAAGADQAPAG